MPTYPGCTIWSLLIAASAVLGSCANVSNPTGGPRDTIPPLLVESDPVHKSVNFQGDRVRLEFQERIVLENLNNNLIITPALDEEFKVKEGKYGMSIILTEKLKDSTTYTFNFTEAVKDLTEGNTAENLVIALSTGDYLDSLMVLGKVEDLLTKTPIAKCIVALYEINDTLDIFTGTPKVFHQDG